MSWEEKMPAAWQSGYRDGVRNFPRRFIAVPGSQKDTEYQMGYSHGETTRAWNSVRT